MKIDIFTHVIPKKYTRALAKFLPESEHGFNEEPSALSDPDMRIELMDESGISVNVLTLGQPPVEMLGDAVKAAYLARIANDALAEYALKNPDRLIPTATLPMNNIDAALEELNRAINELNFKGIQIYTSVNCKPLDSPEFLPVYEEMSRYDLPIWIHPLKDTAESDYPDENRSMYNLAPLIGWPHATAMAMMRISAAGILERYQNLKFITHHSGGTVPYLFKRIECAPFKFENLSRPITDSLRLFYYDTAVQGSTPNLMCAYTFCGVDKMLFATDFPMTSTGIIRQTIESIEDMDISSEEKEKIFIKNAARLLKLAT